MTPELMKQHRLAALMQEAGELVAIAVASIRTARKGSTKARRQKAAIPNPKSAMG